jgi:hypothetical protein
MPTAKLTKEIIDAAILGFEEQKRKIDVQIAGLRALSSGEPLGQASAPASSVPDRKKRKFSAAALKRMKEAQKARWAKVRGETPAAAAPAVKAAKPKRKLSATGRANIVAALKKRWATKKAAAKK